VMLAARQPRLHSLRILACSHDPQDRSARDPREDGRHKTVTSCRGRGCQRCASWRLLTIQAVKRPRFFTPRDETAVPVGPPIEGESPAYAVSGTNRSHLSM
jgi:hypothetical protein